MRSLSAQLIPVLYYHKPLGSLTGENCPLDHVANPFLAMFYVPNSPENASSTTSLRDLPPAAQARLRFNQVQTSVKLVPIPQNHKPLKTLCSVNADHRRALISILSSMNPRKLILPLEREAHENIYSLQNVFSEFTVGGAQWVFNILGFLKPVWF